MSFDVSQDKALDYDLDSRRPQLGQVLPLLPAVQHHGKVIHVLPFDHGLLFGTN
jgi:hypothetical protein